MKNLGSTDRLIRLVFGLALVFGGIAKTGGVGCVFVIVGLILTYTGTSGRCPLYCGLDIDTSAPDSKVNG